jgi:hypothetical protein
MVELVQVYSLMPPHEPSGEGLPGPSGGFAGGGGALQFPASG